MAWKMCFLSFYSIQKNNYILSRILQIFFTVTSICTLAHYKTYNQMKAYQSWGKNHIDYQQNTYNLNSHFEWYLMKATFESKSTRNNLDKARLSTELNILNRPQLNLINVPYYIINSVLGCNNMSGFLFYESDQINRSVWLKLFLFSISSNSFRTLNRLLVCIASR